MGGIWGSLSPNLGISVLSAMSLDLTPREGLQHYAFPSMVRIEWCQPLSASRFGKFQPASTLNTWQSLALFLSRSPSLSHSHIPANLIIVLNNLAQTTNYTRLAFFFVFTSWYRRISSPNPSAEVRHDTSFFTVQPLSFLHICTFIPAHLLPSFILIQLLSPANLP